MTSTRGIFDAFNELRESLPDAAPFQAWTNSLVTGGGHIQEVDAIVITPKGGFVLDAEGWNVTVMGAAEQSSTTTPGRQTRSLPAPARRSGRPTCCRDNRSARAVAPGR